MPSHLGVGKFGKSLALDARERRFKSCHSDSLWKPFILYVNGTGKYYLDAARLFPRKEQRTCLNGLVVLDNSLIRSRSWFDSMLRYWLQVYRLGLFLILRINTTMDFSEQDKKDAADAADKI